MSALCCAAAEDIVDQKCTPIMALVWQLVRDRADKGPSAIGVLSQCLSLLCSLVT